MATGTDIAASAGTEHVRLVSLKVKVVLAALGVALVGFISYGIGTNRGSESSHVLTGQAYVTPVQASVTVHGRVYGFDITSRNLHWYDASGAHDGGVPPCLQHPGTTTIRFGYADTKGPDASSWRVVTWVQCVDHP